MDGGPPASSVAAGSVASANKSIEAGGTAVGTVDHEADEVVGEGRIERLPQRVQEALGELPGAAKEGLLALSVGVGLGVLHEMMEAELDEVVGRMLAGVSTRRYARTGEPVGTDIDDVARSTSKSAVSRELVSGPARTRSIAL